MKRAILFVKLLLEFSMWKFAAKDQCDLFTSSYFCKRTQKLWHEFLLLFCMVLYWGQWCLSSYCTTVRKSLKNWHRFVIKEDITVDAHCKLVVVSSKVVPSSCYYILWWTSHQQQRNSFLITSAFGAALQSLLIPYFL